MITQGFGRRWSFSFKRALQVGGLAVLGMAGPAWGDIPPPEVEACRTAQVGASCQSTPPGGDPGTFTGSCQMATCSKKAPWDRDGSVPPPGIQYDCVKCVAPATDGGTVDASDVSGTGGNSGSGGTTGGTGGTVAVDAPLHPLGAKREPDGCSVSGTQAGRALGPWLMAGAAALMVSLTRRRRRG